MNSRDVLIMNKEQHFLNIIKESFPELDIQNFSVLGNGKCSVACLVNKNIVFKISTESGTRLNDTNKEIFLLPQLESKLSFETPKLLYNKTTEKYGNIIGETLVSGITYSQSLHDSFDDETKSNILRQIGQIARELHSIKIHDDNHIIFISDYKDNISVFHKYFSQDVQKHLNKLDIDKINKICDRYEYLSINYPVQNVLVHADLHFGNMMFNTQTKTVTGLIDFGAAHFAEPSRDMHYYYGSGIEDFLIGYGDNGDSYLRERQQFQAMVNFLSNISDDIKQGESPEKNINKLHKHIF